MVYQIENGIVPPPTRQKSEVRVTCEQLAVGQSFMVPLPLAQASGRVSQIGKALKKKFTAHHVDANMSRVWRVE